MPKSRVNKKTKLRLQRKAQHADAIETSTRIRMLAERLRNNQDLRTCLMQEPDVDRRKAIYEFMVPYLKFENPEFPTVIDHQPRIIIP